MSSVEELELSRNTIRGNTVGVQFGNAGGVSGVAFSGNTISANQNFNVLFANGGFVEDVSFEGDELSTTTMMGGARACLIANTGVAERLSSTEACSSSAITATASGCRTPGDCASCL
jgi:hypothetical protein